jgi:Tol biopolymer transport system component
VKPVWGADGKEIFVATGDRTSSRVVRLPSDGSGPAQTLLEGDNVTFSWPRDVSADGKWLLVVQVRPRTTKEDLWLLSLLPGEHKPEPYLVTDYIETDGMFSPDGRFVAYVSNESGRFELYVRSLPVSAGGKWRISTGGGYQPRWRRDGKELFFFTADGLLMSTDVTLVPTFRASTPRALFLAPIFGGGATTTNQYWDLTPDGQRFLINTTSANDRSSVLTVVLNWQSGSASAGRE